MSGAHVVSRPARFARRVPAWLIVALATVLYRIPSFLRPLFDDDEGQYAAIGELIRRGGQLYGNGGVDNKPPGIYWTYASVFELAGPYAMWAVHVVALIVVASTACVLCAIATRLASRRAGLLAGVFYGVFSTVYYPKMLAANTEIFMMLALSGAVWLVLVAREAPIHARAALFGAGALVAVACGYKQLAALNLLVIVGGALATRARVVGIVVGVAGFALMLGAGALIVMSTSSLPAMWHWCVTQLRSYGASAWNDDVLYHAAVGLLPFIAASLLVWVAGAAAAWRAVRSGVAMSTRIARREVAGAKASTGERVVWLWFAISLASSFSGGHFFGHYFIQPLAPLVAIAGIELDRRLAATTRPWLARWITALTMLPAAGFFVFNVVFEPLTDSFGEPSPDYRRPVAWVRDHTSPDERIFVWGNFASLYVLADRLPSSRFVGFLRGAARHRNAAPETAWDMGPEVWTQLADDFAQHPPQVILDTSTANYMSFGHYPIARFPALAMLLRDYRVAAVVDGVTMYTPRRGVRVATPLPRR